MARIRTIKPEFFTSEDIVSLSPLARLLYIAVWCEADKEGRLLWKPGTFKLRYFPADDCDIHDLCDELVDQGLVVPYGDGLAYVPRFAQHQHVNPREAASTLPEPDPTAIETARVEHASSTRRDASARVPDAQGGREGKGKERKTPPPPPASPLFDRFWAAYPKRRSRGDAERAFAKLNPSEQQVEAMIAAISRAKTSDQWAKDGGQFIPHPATWLRDRGWEDVFDPSPAAPARGSQIRLAGGFVA